MDPIELSVFLSDSLPSAKEDYRFAEGHVHTDTVHVVFFIQRTIPENDPHDAWSWRQDTSSYIQHDMKHGLALSQTMVSERINGVKYGGMTAEIETLGDNWTEVADAHTGLEDLKI